MTQKYSIWLNAAGLLAICMALLFAFSDQVLYHDLPCPLCLLQRAGLVAAGFGLALNLGIALQPSHYGLMILGAMTGGGIAARQVALHIVPGTGAYGNAFLGLHYYTWNLIICVIIVTGGALLLLVEQRDARSKAASKQSVKPSTSKRSTVHVLPLALFALIVAANAVSALLECGSGMCPSDPVQYLLWPTL